MLERLLLILVLAFAGIAPACAARAPAGEVRFEQLVSEARKAIMADPAQGLAKARALVTFAERQEASADQREMLAKGLWLTAEALTRSNKVDEARTTLDRAIKIASADGRLTELDGNLALALARVAREKGDIALSLKSHHKAHEIFVRIGQPRGQAIALQGLGVIYEQARDVQRATDYYTRAVEIYSEEPALRLSIENNLGITLRDVGRYERSLAHFRKALAEAKSLGSNFLRARVLTNIAVVQAKMGRLAAAQRSADAALRQLGVKDVDGWAPFIWGVKADISFRRGNLALAEANLQRAFSGVDLTKTIAPFRDAHELAYRIYSGAGNHALALAHLEAFKRLDDEGRTLAASANLALMSARFDFANQKLVIERLKTERLQREASLRESRAAAQRLFFLILISIALAFMIWMSWRHRLLREHRDKISRTNVDLKRILGERDSEISLRRETEAHLRVAMEAAEQANRAKTKFLANMSHELRTPLNAIIGFSEIIATGILPQAKAGEYAGDINLSGRRLLAILNDILETARLDAGSIAITEGEVTVADVIETAIAKVAGQTDITRKAVTLAGDRSLRVRGDEQRLVQVFEKLLLNAAKFTVPEGHIDIVLASAKDGGVDITVADDGVGIPPEQLDNIMERFGQIESAYARSHGGIGLGLPIAKSLIALHGGTLSIRSETNKGTSVRVHLPPERRLPSTTHTAAA